MSWISSKNFIITTFTVYKNHVFVYLNYLIDDLSNYLFTKLFKLCKQGQNNIFHPEYIETDYKLFTVSQSSLIGLLK